MKQAAVNCRALLLLLLLLLSISPTDHRINHVNTARRAAVNQSTFDHNKQQLRATDS